MLGWVSGGALDLLESAEEFLGVVRECRDERAVPPDFCIPSEDDELAADVAAADELGLGCLGWELLDDPGVG